MVSGTERAGSPAGAEAYLPDRRTLADLRRGVGECRGCDLYEHAIQGVLGVGPSTARLFLVGEQPGDMEDRAGEPFVGPAGRVLDRALDEVGLERDQVYLTNVVKHFRFSRAERGNRRLHQKPLQRQITACRPWLRAELEVVRPRVVVCLGATAAQALLGGRFRVGRGRGELVEIRAADLPAGLSAVATVHPSAILRARDDREAVYQGLRSDLAVAAAACGG